MTSGALSRQVGQLILGKIKGTSLSDEERELLRSGIMGGVTLFKDNVKDLSTLVVMIDEIRALAPEALIAIDQEGGAVQRLDHIASPLPSAAALALAGDDAVFEACEISGRQLKLIGINVNFAPVLDCNTNPQNPIIGTRAFGQSPAVVTAAGSAAVRGFKRSGILCVGKHFPGHGDTAVDSHYDMPVIEHSLDRLMEVELVPFVDCLSELPSILTAHVWVKSCDGEKLPASLSRSVTTGLLRERLGFDGLVFTDDLLMSGVTKSFGVAEACVRAFDAGADQLLVCGSADDVRDGHTRLCREFEAGRLCETRLSRSLSRRAEAHCKLAFDARPAATRIEELERRLPSDTARLVELAERAIANLDPLPYITHPVALLVPEHPRYGLPYAKRIHDAGLNLNIEEIRYPLSPAADDIERLEERIKGKHVWLVTFRAVINRGQVDLARRVVQVAFPDFLIAGDLPYDAESINGFKNTICLQDPEYVGQSVLVRYLSRTFESDPGQRGPESRDSKKEAAL